MAELQEHIGHGDGRGRCLRELLPNESRWFRPVTIKAYGLDQPNSLFDSEGNPRPNDNPELEKYELSVNLSKVFWSSDELVDAYQLAESTATLSMLDASSFRSQYLSDAMNGQDVLAFFARTENGKTSGLRRFATAWTFSAGQSERQRHGLGSDDWEETWGFVFDPKKWILTSDRVLTAYKGLQAYTKVHGVPSGLTDGSVMDRPTPTLRRWSGLPIMSQGAVALIPTVEFKTVDQFDFLTVGSLLVPSPHIEGSIETVTLTWDLSASLDTTKKRRDALRAIALHRELVERDRVKILPRAPRNVPRFCVGDFLTLQFTVEPGIEEPRWNVDRLPAGLVLQRNGLLHGYVRTEGETRYTLTVTGKDGNALVTEERTILVEGCPK
jgi:hypothetical protein